LPVVPQHEFCIRKLGLTNPHWDNQLTDSDSWAQLPGSSFKDPIAKTLPSNAIIEYHPFITSLLKGRSSTSKPFMAETLLEEGDIETGESALPQHCTQINGLAETFIEDGHIQSGESAQLQHCTYMSAEVDPAWENWEEGDKCMTDGFGAEDQYLQANDANKAVSSPREDGRMDTTEPITEVTMEEEVAEIEERRDEILEGHDNFAVGLLEALQNTKLSPDEGPQFSLKSPSLEKPTEESNFDAIFEDASLGLTALNPKKAFIIASLKDPSVDEGPLESTSSHHAAGHIGGTLPIGHKSFFNTTYFQLCIMGSLYVTELYT
jgi:hypothetical protein